MDMREMEDAFDKEMTMAHAKPIARAMIEEAAKQGAREEEVKLACELALATYREGADAYRQFFAQIDGKFDAALAARKGEKKPPTREGERLERLLNTSFKPGSVYVKLEVHSAETKEICIVKIPEEQAERMIEQLMAEPEDCSEG